jgi:hypothetical protein
MSHSISASASQFRVPIPLDTRCFLKESRVLLSLTSAAGKGRSIPLSLFSFLCYSGSKRLLLSDRDILLHEINTLPAECLGEVVDFVEYVKRKQLKKIPETMFLSEVSLAREWDTPEEDEAWRNL